MGFLLLSTSTVIYFRVLRFPCLGDTFVEEGQQPPPIPSTPGLIEEDRQEDDEESGEDNPHIPLLSYQASSIQENEKRKTLQGGPAP